MTRVEHRSNREDWGTPPEVFAYCARRWGPFDLDAAATEANALCDRYLSDALEVPWTAKRVWINPPYNRRMLDWARKMRTEILRPGGPGLICALVAARTSTWWWWELCREEIFFIRGRLRFVGAESGAPFPSAIIILRRRPIHHHAIGMIAREDLR